ncbi:MAG TPA: tetratricopeptide repeat protein [Steroidobacteraceae bacterium]
MRTAFQVLSVCLLVNVIPAAWANGGGGMSMPAMPATPREQTPQQKAKDAYNDGVRYVKKADKAQSAAMQASDAGKKDQAAREAHDLYAKSLAKFQEAVQLDETLHEAWNYVGFTNRKLGNYDEALAAYDKALALKPGYPDALEYRGEAYLALNRIADAQQAYLDLYAGNRALAGKLLAAMRSWVATQRASPATSATGLDDLDKWIQERAQIAGQTAALTRAGTAASWR